MTNTTSPCGDSNPFMKLGDGAGAPSLNYQLPQKTTYRVNGYFPVDIPSDWFDGSLANLPANNPWDAAASMISEDILNTLRHNLHSGARPWLILNAHILRGRRDLIKILKSNPATAFTTNTNAETGTSDTSLRTIETTTSSTAQPLRLNHQNALMTAPAEHIQVAGFTLADIATQLENGLVPELYTTFSGRVRLRFLPRPVARPTLSVIEHYKMASYLGDYGAGKTIKTFSLLPGEKTTLTLKSYRDQRISTSQSQSSNSNEQSSSYFDSENISSEQRSEHILDSFSEYSAQQMQEQVQAIESANVMDQEQEVDNFTIEGGGGAQGGINLLGLVNFQAGGSMGAAYGTTNASNSVREDHMSTISTALDATVTESGQARDVEVNTTSGNLSNESSGGFSSVGSSVSYSGSEQNVMGVGSENLTVRQISNINHSRVLNFVFRQMLQEYVVLTYMDDVSIQFSNGAPGATKRVKLSKLPALIAQIIPDPQNQEEALRRVLMQLCNVANYQGMLVPFAEKVTQSLTDCFGGNAPVEVDYWRKRAELADSYTSGGLEIAVKGIITQVSRYTLPTDSVIVDAILGQGEALDCYNTRMQESAVVGAELRNGRTQEEQVQYKRRMDISLDAIAALPTEAEKVDALKQLFGECCSDEILAALQSHNP